MFPFTFYYAQANPETPDTEMQWKQTKQKKSF